MTIDMSHFEVLKTCRIYDFNLRRKFKFRLLIYRRIIVYEILNIRKNVAEFIKRALFL